LKPNTSYEVLKPLIHKLDMVLVMTVEPGYGGQKFIEKTLDTMRGTAGLIKEIGADIDIEVDGGIYEENACVPISAGANVIVAGSAFFKSFDPATTVHKLRGN